MFPPKVSMINDRPLYGLSAMVLTLILWVGPARADLCEWNVGGPENPTEQFLILDYRGGTLGNISNATVLKVPEGTRVTAKYKGKTAQIAAQANKKQAYIRLGVKPDLIKPKQEDTQPWRVVLDIVSQPMKNYGGLDDKAQKKFDRDLAALVDRLPKGPGIELDLKQKNELQSRGSLELIITDPLKKFPLFAPRTRPPKVVVISDIVRPTNLESYARGLARRQNQYFRQKARVDGLQNQLMAKLDKIDEFPDLESIPDQILPVLEEAGKRRARIDELAGTIKELKETELKELEKQYRTKYEEKEKFRVLYVDVRKPHKMERSYDYISGFRTLDEQIKETRSKLKETRDRYRRVYEQQYIDGILDSREEVDRRVKNATNVKKHKKILRWLKKQRKKHKAKLAEKEEAVADAREKRYAVQARISKVEEEKKKLEWKDMDAQTGDALNYEDALKLLGDDGRAPSVNDAIYSRSGDKLQKAIHWIRQRYDKKISAQRGLQQKALALFRSFTSEDRKLGVIARDLMARRIDAGVAVCFALKKLDSNLYAEMLKPLSKYLDDLSYANAVFESLGQGDLKNMGGYKPKTEDFAKAGVKTVATIIRNIKAYEGLQKRIKIAEKVFKPFKTQSDRVKLVLESLDKYERNDPQFVIDALKMAKEVTGLLPLEGHPVAQAIDFYAEVGAAIIRAGDSIATKMMIKAREAVRKRSHMETPERKLYTKRMIKNAIHYKHYAMTDKDIEKIATDFQARRILYLLSVKTLRKM
jgi:hypothetical protein